MSAASPEVWVVSELYYPEATSTAYCLTGIAAGLARADIAARRLRNVTLHPPVPRDELPAALGTADVALVALLPGMTGVLVPSRMYNILAAGKPLIAIAERDSEVALLVEEERIGWVVEPSDAGAPVAAIADARRDEQRLAEMGTRARSVAGTRYSRQHVVGGWTELVRDVRDGSR